MKKCLLLYGLLALGAWEVTGVGLSEEKPLDISRWKLRDLVQHIQSAGIAVTVVPTHSSGQWGNNIYLSEDPQASWHTFLAKSRTLERLDQWQGCVWVEHTSRENADLAFPDGCTIGRFHIFGDAQLVERICSALER